MLTAGVSDCWRRRVCLFCCLFPTFISSHIVVNIIAFATRQCAAWSSMMITHKHPRNNDKTSCFRMLARVFFFCRQRFLTWLLGCLFVCLLVLLATLGRVFDPAFFCYESREGHYIFGRNISEWRGSSTIAINHCSIKHWTIVADHCNCRATTQNDVGIPVKLLQYCSPFETEENYYPTNIV